jgi:hypothetical protein
MRALTKLAYPLAVLATLAVAAAPAQAQYEGAGDQVTQQFTPMMQQFGPMMEQLAPMMEQMAPMMQMMKSQMGNKRMGQLMQNVAPMMAGMMGSGGGDFGMAGLQGMMGNGSTKRARAKY